MRCIILSLGFLASQLASADVLFEAFYRIEKQGKHTGYFIERVSEDKSAGTKTVTMYSRQIQEADREAYISYRSVAKAGTGEPVSSKYSSSLSGAPLEILATFQNGVGKIINTVQKKKATAGVAKKTNHMSGFLFLFADLRKLVPGTDYEYHTYAEEAGRRATGTLSLAGEKNLNGQRILHVVNSWLGQPVENFITESGDPLGARNPAGDFDCFWVATKEEAVGMFSYPTAEFTTLFGDLPEGNKNPWMKSKVDAAAFIKSFPKSEGSRGLSSSLKPLKIAPLPLRKI